MRGRLTFDYRNLATAVYKFRDDWLTRPDLGRPATFVLCTSAKLDDTTAWENQKRELSEEIGVAIEEWHRDTLDRWLRIEPGIVAELFGDRVAELFCDRAHGWSAGLFRPLVAGAEKRYIDRYLDLVAQDRFDRDERDEAEFERIFRQHDVLLFGGRYMPGDIEFSQLVMAFTNSRESIAGVAFDVFTGNSAVSTQNGDARCAPSVM